MKQHRKLQKPLLLSQYTETLRKEVAAFELQWIEHQTKEGTNMWPREMNPGDWDEQFTAFLQSRRY